MFQPYGENPHVISPIVNAWLFHSFGASFQVSVILYDAYAFFFLKVINPKHATELAQLYEVAFSVFACIESEPRGERVPCHITLRFLQRVDFEGNLVVLKKTNYKSSWIDITKTSRAQLNTEENSVVFYADTFSM